MKIKTYQFNCEESRLHSHICTDLNISAFPTTKLFLGDLPIRQWVSWPPQFNPNESSSWLNTDINGGRRAGVKSGGEKSSKGIISSLLGGLITRKNNDSKNKRWQTYGYLNSRWVHTYVGVRNWEYLKWTVDWLLWWQNSWFGKLLGRGIYYRLYRGICWFFHVRETKWHLGDPALSEQYLPNVPGPVYSGH